MKYSRKQRAAMRRPNETDTAAGSPLAENTSEDASSGTLFFWKPHEVPYGFLCQWFTAHFRDSSVHQDHTFNCAEQYMMYRKALILATPDADDAATSAISGARRTSQQKVNNRPVDGRRAQISNVQKDPSRLPVMILAEQDPGRQKALARSLRFTEAQSKQWDSTKFDVVVQGNYCKFKQNPELLRQLLATRERELVEASPEDNVWGIGHAAEFAEVHREHWGSNLLGKALMVVRERLRAETREGAGQDATSVRGLC